MNDFYVIYSFIICTNQYLNIIEINTSSLYGSNLRNRHAFGLFGDSGNLSNIHYIIYVLYLPHFFPTLPRTTMNIKYTRLVFIVTILLVQSLMSASRSVFLLSFFGVLLLYLYSKIFKTKVLNKTTNFAPLITFSTISDHIFIFFF